MAVKMLAVGETRNTLAAKFKDMFCDSPFSHMNVKWEKETMVAVCNAMLPTRTLPVNSSDALLQLSWKPGDEQSGPMPNG
jgi:hypothetical protein